MGVGANQRREASTGARLRFKPDIPNPGAGLAPRLRKTLRQRCVHSLWLRADRMRQEIMLARQVKFIAVHR